LVRWVWIGGIVMFFGTIVIMVPDKRELKLVRQPLQKVAAVSEGEKTDVEVA
jgi:cytochrome c biogenesis factor